MIFPLRPFSQLFFFSSGKGKNQRKRKSYNKALLTAFK
ncbi:Hypothetical protein Minf_1742 [Methylacidiphilum infernorum V4]|uniref:Uncharacterized protein n=1 Tax=Methylacidiphilum infernorum (isolate V4) TaxID=481448 RepID=B3DX87_METI4|nr:Hypothetical protein Minf_1742 [Methylacidiphilum infernorum V4]